MGMAIHCKQDTENDAYYIISAQEQDKYGVDRAGEETKRPWNVALLRPFYS